jgi:type I restriction enzyme S subunit
VSWGEFLPDENKALPKTLEPRLDCVVESGDFLITRANTDELVARSVVVENCPPNLMLSDKIVRLRLSLLCNNKFINLVNLSPFSRNYYALAAGGTSSSMKNVTREQILNLVIGMPPLAEQHRIVAKVDELMMFCDQLKSRITTANKQQKKLADVLVEHTVVG